MALVPRKLPKLVVIAKRLARQRRTARGDRDGGANHFAQARASDQIVVRGCFQYGGIGTRAGLTFAW